MTGQPDSTGDLAAWDAAAQAYAGLVGSGDTITLRFRQFLAQALGEPAGLEILDLGCGHGWLARELARQGARVTGVDGSARLLDIARATHPAYGWATSAGLDRLRRVTRDHPHHDRSRGAARPQWGSDDLERWRP